MGRLLSPQAGGRAEAPCQERRAAKAGGGRLHSVPCSEFRGIAPREVDHCPHPRLWTKRSDFAQEERQLIRMKSSVEIDRIDMYTKA